MPPDPRPPDEQVTDTVALLNDAWVKIAEFGAGPAVSEEAQAIRSEGFSFLLIGIEKLAEMIREHGPDGQAAVYAVISELDDAPRRFLAAQLVQELATTDWELQYDDDDDA